MGNKKQEKSLVMKKLILLIAAIGIVCAEDYRQTGLCPKVKQWSTDIAQGVSECVQKMNTNKVIYWLGEKVGLIDFENRLIAKLIDSSAGVAGCKRRRLNLWDSIKSFTKSAVCKVWNAGISGTCNVAIKSLGWILKHAEVPLVCVEEVAIKSCVSHLGSSCTRRRRMPLYPY